MDALTVSVRRGDMVESRHAVHAVAVQEGRIVESAGDPSLVTFFRSSAKPLQAVPLARDYPDLPEDELAIACASHRAAPAQLDAVRRLLARAGATEDDLELGPQEGRGPEKIRHNCSGKHAGFLAVCRARGWSSTGYRLREHPLQRELLAEVARATKSAAETIPLAVDGCSVVTFALPLERMARAFSRIEEPIAAAMRARPELVGGEGAEDTELMRTLPGWVAKGGAEGLLCAASADGLGVALKAADGARRALRPALARFFERLGLPLGGEFARVPILNSRGEEVGELT